MQVTLRYDEAVFVAAHLRRLLSWDERTAVRIQVRGQSLGLFASPPLGVMSLIAVPVTDALDVDGLDRVVSAGRLRDVLGDVARLSAAQEIPVRIPDAVLGPPSLAMLPPREGWFPPVSTIAGDLVADVDESIRLLQQRTQGSLEPFAQQIAEDVWSKPGWAALPQRVLHAARQLGFLGHPGARIHASVNGVWKRLMSPAGQVFVRTESAVPSLRVVR